jgi:hypothetical protein
MLHPIIEEYHDLLSKNYLESTAQILNEVTEKEKLTVPGRPVCSVLRPFFLDHPTYDRVKKASILIMTALATMGKRLMQDSQLRSRLDLSAEEEEVVQIDTGFGYPDLSARLDSFLGDGGELSFIEYNADSPGGIGFGDLLANAFAATPLMKELGKRYEFVTFPVRDFVRDRLLGAYHRWGGSGTPNIAIIDWRKAATYNEFVIFQRYFASCGIEARIADPEEVEFKDGKLLIGDFKADLVYKRLTVGEMLARYGLSHPIVRAAREKACCVANGFGVQMLFKKGMFALLSDPQTSGFLDPDSAAAVSRFIPWTRKVLEGFSSYKGERVDLVPFVVKHRDRLVLKPNSEYGGKGVVLGWETDEAGWTGALREALNGSYVVQERVPVGRQNYPQLVDGVLHFDERYFDLDPYVWDSLQVEGCGVRLSRSALLNVSAGGGSAVPMLLFKSRN